MAIDSSAKRSSAMGAAMPWMPLVNPDAAKGEDWRATVAFVYGGNALSPPVGGSSSVVIEMIMRWHEEEELIFRI